MVETAVRKKKIIMHVTVVHILTSDMSLSLVPIGINIRVDPLLLWIKRTIFPVLRKWMTASLALRTLLFLALFAVIS